MIWSPLFLAGLQCTSPIKEQEPMSVEKTLQARSESHCELCGLPESLGIYEIPPSSNGSADECVLLCATCRQQVEDPVKTDVQHWRCLNESMWSQVPAVHAGHRMADAQTVEHRRLGAGFAR